MRFLLVFLIFPFAIFAEDLQAEIKKVEAQIAAERAA